MNIFLRNARLQFNKLTPSMLINNRSYREASEVHNFRKLKLIKRLASTFLFGGTFLIVLYSRKRKRSNVFEDAKLVSNRFYSETFKLYNYQGYILPFMVMKNLDRVKSFVCREDDVFVVSFPKTGTTWLQEVVYSIMKGIEDASQTMDDRFPYLEFWYPGISSIEKMPDQRFIKSHLPFSLLPDDIKEKKPKILCIMRNPKDVLVSYYHFVRMITVSNYKGNFQDFFEDFMLDEVPYGPVWKHYNEIWEHRHDDNVLIISYEDLNKDINGTILKIAEFLGKNLTPSEIRQIAEHCSFYNMSKNPSVNYQHWDDLGIRNQQESKFMRKGEVGDWKNYLSSEMNDKIESWINKNFNDVSAISGIN